jgi:hypothetical protein
MVSLVGNTSHKNGILLGTKFMGEHLSIVRGNLYRFEMVVDETIGCLCPFEYDIRPLFPMECKETTVKSLALCFENTYLDLNACILEFLDASSLHFCKFIDATHDDTPDSLLDDQIGTGRCLAIVGTRFQRDIHRGSWQQSLVFLSY